MTKMTLKDLKDALQELEKMGVDMNKRAVVASHDGVKGVKSVFNNGLGDIYLDVRS